MHSKTYFFQIRMKKRCIPFALRIFKIKGVSVRVQVKTSQFPEFFLDGWIMKQFSGVEEDRNLSMQACKCTP